MCGKVVFSLPKTACLRDGRYGPLGPRPLRKRLSTLPMGEAGPARLPFPVIATPSFMAAGTTPAPASNRANGIGSSPITEQRGFLTKHLRALPGFGGPEPTAKSRAGRTILLLLVGQ